ncbi:MAG: hotdog domain-containing protein, partial [Comamonas sp.]
MQRDDFQSFQRIEVRWAEVDAQKIVFNAHYLMYADVAITRYWRQLAIPYESGFSALGGELFVKKATTTYHGSATLGDVLDVGIRCV